MSLSRRWPSWIILLCWLTPADATSCFAADPPPPARPVDAKPGAAAAPRMAEKKRPDPPANRGSLLGAIVEAMGGDLDGNRRRAQAAEEQTVRNMEPQFRPQFQQLLYCELAFLRRVCKPDPKSFAEVAKAAKAGLQAPLREYIVSRWVPRPGVPKE